MIEIVNLVFHYPDGRAALDKINLVIHPGEKVALVGANGAGKSTLLLHLNGILQDEGLVKINGFEVNKQNLPKIRSLVGMVFQNPDDQLFSLTVGEDVAFGPIYQGFESHIVDDKVKNALSDVQLSGFEDRHPFHLSGGEKKRASVATVLSMSPEYLVLDEPTAGLDPKSRKELMALLKTLPQSLIIATHDLKMALDLTDRVILINHGKIAADGKTKDILLNEEILHENDLL
ncbi:MAG: cobalt ABC transporter ATP-binding protein [Chloroflexi bacterium HGW-Chloroflexi-4]|jgi:energy-coupling factor transporter ATP-binding protein EcfA2|nr:MAG: cobalt ABC transporter ATP-binding protein [Chloroflexi bacterium HGW-Chloroflexi-4]